MLARVSRHVSDATLADTELRCTAPASLAAFFGSLQPEVLESVTLFYGQCGSVPAAALQALTQFPPLQQLGLDAHALPPGAPAAIAQLPEALCRLSVECFSPLPAHVGAVARRTRLTHLELTVCEPFPPLEPPTALEGLCGLKLHQEQCVKGGFLPPAPPRFPRLHTFALITGGMDGNEPHDYAKVKGGAFERAFFSWPGINADRPGLVLMKLRRTDSLGQLLGGLVGPSMLLERLELQEGSAPRAPALRGSRAQLAALTSLKLSGGWKGRAGGEALGVLLDNAPRLAEFNALFAVEALPPSLVQHRGLSALHLSGNGLHALPEGPYLPRPDGAESVAREGHQPGASAAVCDSPAAPGPERRHRGAAGRLSRCCCGAHAWAQAPGHPQQRAH